jgi:uncharacterized Tic20 family protein
MEEKTTVQDERVMAALAHAAVILPMWGMLVSVIIWATQKDESERVRFQALQGLVYQFLPLLGFGIFFLCFTLSTVLSVFSSMLLPMSFVFLEGMGEQAGVFAFLISLVSSLFGFGMPFVVFALALLVWFAYLIYAIYGAIRNLQGEPFRYVVIGPWLERQLNR